MEDIESISTPSPLRRRRTNRKNRRCHAGRPAVDIYVGVPAVDCRERPDVRHDNIQAAADRIDALAGLLHPTAAVSDWRHPDCIAVAFGRKISVETPASTAFWAAGIAGRWAAGTWAAGTWAAGTWAAGTRRVRTARRKRQLADPLRCGGGRIAFAIGDLGRTVLDVFPMHDDLLTPRDTGQ